MARGSAKMPSRDVRCVVKYVLAFVLACGALRVANNYVAQLRYDILTFRPCDMGICALYIDRRSGETFWVPMPEPPSRDIVPGVDRGPKVQS